MEWMARAGFAARGLVYLLLGFLATLAALDSGYGSVASKGVLRTILDEPFGWLLLAFLGVGLSGFGAWRLAEALFDADRRGSRRTAIAVRAARGIAGLIALGLAAFAIILAFGRFARPGLGFSNRDWTAWLLRQPFGPWVLGLIGIGVIGVGAAFLVEAWGATFMRGISCRGGARTWITALGRFGFVARGFAFGLVGVFLILAAWQDDATRAKGLAGALATLQAAWFGWILLCVAGFGLAAFGVFGLVQSIYRRIDAPKLE